MWRRTGGPRVAFCVLFLKSWTTIWSYTQLGHISTAYPVFPSGRACHLQYAFSTMHRNPPKSIEIHTPPSYRTGYASDSDMLQIQPGSCKQRQPPYTEINLAASIHVNLPAGAACAVLAVKSNGPSIRSKGCQNKISPWPSFCALGAVSYVLAVHRAQVRQIEKKRK